MPDVKTLLHTIIFMLLLAHLEPFYNWLQYIYFFVALLECKRLILDKSICIQFSIERCINILLFFMAMLKYWTNEMKI